MNTEQYIKEIRHDILVKRRSLEAQQCSLAGLSVLNFLFAHPFFKQKKLTVASYVSIRGEIETKDINLNLQRLGHIVALPKIGDPKHGLMDFYATNSLTDHEDLICGTYGIQEPEGDPNLLITPDRIDVVLLPLVAFDRHGHRLGMGGGFYDRFLKKLPVKCRLIGLAHDFQEVNLLPKQEWDMDLDEIITPSRHLIF